MQNDLIVNLITKVPYPFVKRHDRNLYADHQELDPLKLIKKVLIASTLGYFVGKFIKRK